MCTDALCVCVVPLSACSLVRDGWVWVPFTAPGPALFWSYRLHAPLWRGRHRKPSITQGYHLCFFVSHFLLFFEESWLESGQGEILLKSRPFSTIFFNRHIFGVPSHLLFLPSLAVSECLSMEVYVSRGKYQSREDSRRGGAVCGTVVALKTGSPAPGLSMETPGHPGVGNFPYLQISLSSAPLLLPSTKAEQA